jgi:putative ABC transport system permease protein
MSLFTLLRRNLLRHKLRNALTALAVAVALFLFCFLFSVITTLRAAVSSSSADRVVVQSAVSLFMDLPKTYTAKLADVEGVESVARWNWFGGVYRDPSNFFAQFAVDPEIFLAQFPECVITPEERAAWLADRRGCLIGRGLARKFGWKIGDTVPLIGTIYTRPEGAAWEFTVRGIYSSTKTNLDESTMWFQYEYLDEGIETGGVQGPKGVGVFYVKTKPGTGLAEITRRIDARFEGDEQRTLTQTEAAFQAGFITMLGSVPAFLSGIGGAVLFAILFSVVNTMMITSRERTKELGVLQALGFRRAVGARLLLFESMLLCGIGGLAGLALGASTEGTFREMFGTQIPGYTVEPLTLVIGVAIALAVGAAGGLFPALQARGLRVADALRAEA